MNIFKVLANGYGNINENNVSAFLGYLLDPRADHGLNDEFLKIFLTPLGEKYFKDDTNISFENLSVNSDYVVEIFFEKEFYPKEKRLEEEDKAQRIDIIIKISKKRKESKKGESIFLTPTPVLIILVENKINDEAYQPGQIIAQQNALKNYLQSIIPSSDKEAQTLKDLIGSCFSIYVTTDGGKYEKAYKSAISEIDESKKIKGFHWRWKTNTKHSIHNQNDSGTIYGIITDLFKKESEGSIEPMNDITKHTLKAFKNFIETNFKSKLEEGKIDKRIYDHEIILSQVKEISPQHYPITKKWYDLLIEKFPEIEFSTGRKAVGRINRVSFPFEQGSQKVAFQIMFRNDGIQIQLLEYGINGIDLAGKYWKRKQNKKKETQYWFKKVSLDSETNKEDDETVCEFISKQMNNIK